MPPARGPVRRYWQRPRSKWCFLRVTCTGASPAALATTSLECFFTCNRHKCQ
uniref:Uncharacterized protein n=1 Tax=Octopus bimaculoides TaxID=37653 RepID=A0A0L8GE37_OCTBM